MRREEHWHVVPQLGAMAVRCSLLPDDTLQYQDVTDGVVWETTGDHAGFQIGHPISVTGLPAGWYELCGRIECLDGTVTLPSLQPGYAQTGVTPEEIALPDPAAFGQVRVLVLFTLPVVTLRFCPGVWAARFRMHDFSLRRVSRLTALWKMLGDRGPGTTAHGWALRWVTFMARWRAKDLQSAVTDAFSAYLERQRPPGMSDFDVWIRKYDTITPSRIAALQHRAALRAGIAVSFSILLPVSQRAMRDLPRCIDSVRRQLWEGWELCVVGDVSCDAAARIDLKAYAAEDPRIRVASILASDSVAAFNHALEMATGSHVIVLGADAELRGHTLLEMVALVRQYPDVGFAYADEDWVGGAGQRYQPYFKPQWNPDLLRSHNYIGQFALIRIGLAREVHGLRDGYADSAFHDLFLRCTERLARAQIRHVPQILCHRRESGEPTASSHWNPADTAPDGARAVAAQLERRGIDAKVDPCPGRTFHVRWPLPTPLPKICLVIPTRDRVDLLRTCVESILDKTTWPNLEVIVVDNQSVEHAALSYLDQLRGRNGVRVLRDDAPFNYSAINNRAVAQCDGELVGLVNNDIEVLTPGWLEEMAGHALRSEVGAVGAMLYYPGDTIQHAGVIVGLHGVADHIHAGRPRGWPGHGHRAWVAQELSAVTGACLLVRRATYQMVGGLDERLAVAFNDVDFCLRLREHGLHNIWTPYAELYHHESASRGCDDAPERRARFAGEIAYMQHRWATVLHQDPAYNPNLSLVGSDSELAFPPRVLDGPSL